MADWSFRQRFEVAPGARLPFQEDVCVLHREDDVVVEIRSAESKPIAESALLTIRGAGYPKDAEARSEGRKWREAVQRALAAVDVGANFGFRDPSMGGFTDIALEEMKAACGVTALNDSWEVLVFPSEPSPVFYTGSAAGFVLCPPTVALQAIAASRRLDEPPNEIAFDLFSASMRV